MTSKIKIKRGTKAQLPLLELAEPGFTTDTKKLYIGDGISNIKINDSTASGIEYTDTEDYYNGTTIQDILSEIGETRIISGYDLTDTTSLPDISFVDGTRTFNVTVQSGESNFYFWTNSHKQIKTSSHSVVIPNVTNTYYIYFDNAGVLQYVAESNIVLSVFYEFAITGLVYWNATAGTSMAGDERHGKLMDGRTHHFNHVTIGARYESGLDITGLADGSSTYTNTTAGFFWDEDIRHTLALQTQHPFIYKLGSTGEWTGITPDSNVGFKNGTSNVVWNEWTGTTWQLTEGTATTDFMIYFMVATPDLAGYNVKKIIGQNGYSNRASARTAIETEISNLVIDGLPSPEFIFLNAYIVNRDGNLEELGDGSTHLDLRALKGGTGSSSGSSSVAADVSVNTDNFDTHLSSSDTNVQLALDTLDDHVHPSSLACIDVYDNTGGQTFTTTSTILNLDTIRKNVGGFSLASDEVTAVHGTYLVVARVSVGSTNRATAEAWIELNTGSGYSEIDGTRGIMYCRNQATGENTCTIPAIIDLNADDKLRVRMVRTTGTTTITTKADACGLVITTIGGPAGSNGSDGADGVDGAPGPAGSGSSINVYDEGTVISGSPFQTINFNGLDVEASVTSGTVDVTYTSPVFGTWYGWTTSESESSTTSTSWQQKLRYSLIGIPAGNYRIGYQWEWKRDSAATDFNAQVQIDDTNTISNTNCEPKDIRSWYLAHGFYIAALTAGNHYIDIDYCGETTANTNYIRSTRIECYRVS